MQKPKCFQITYISFLAKVNADSHKVGQKRSQIKRFKSIMHSAKIVMAKVINSFKTDIQQM